jgi:N-acetyl-anhydromuramyl-L-alanine amidase AmpD
VAAMALLEDMATMKLLGDAAPRLDPRMIIVHTMAGFLKGTDAEFHNSNLESHFGIGGPADGADFDGVIWQWVDTDRQADANRKANAFALSIETSDGKDHRNPWSAKQLDSLIKLMGRLCDTHKIPRRVVTAWDDPVGGIGWHTMFGAPSNWTKVSKVCPGPTRIGQLHDTVFPALGVTAEAGPNPGANPGPAATGGAVNPPFPGIVFKRHASSGPDVCRIQERLRALGHVIDRKPNCPFGPQTETAVIAFQKDHNLGDDGKVGKDTWNALFG